MTPTQMRAFHVSILTLRQCGELGGPCVHFPDEQVGPRGGDLWEGRQD